MAFDFHKVQFTAMGSRCELQLYIPESNTLESIAAPVIGEIRRLEEKYTRYKPNSVTSIINNSAGSGNAIEVDPETATILQYADVLFQQSNGLFDITSGVLRRVWDFKSGQLPTQDAVEAVLPLIGWDKLIWNAPFIELPKAGMQIDFGGYVKEYAADIAANLCVSLGIRHGLVNLGGDVKIIGPHPDGSPWIVGIQHPREPGKAIATIDLHTGAIATSGDYERFMIVNGIRYCHLLNPKTGNSIQPRYASVSVIAEQCVVAGSFSTIAILKDQDDPQWLDDTGLVFMVVTQDMQILGPVNSP